MKDFIYCTIITLLIVGFGCKLFIDIHQQQREENEIHFIWNDDEESIPIDGTLIMLEITKGNDIYIGPYYPKVDTTDVVRDNFDDSYFIDAMNHRHLE